MLPRNKRKDKKRKRASTSCTGNGKSDNLSDWKQHQEENNPKSKSDSQLLYKEECGNVKSVSVANNLHEEMGLSVTLEVESGKSDSNCSVRNMQTGLPQPFSGSCLLYVDDGIKSQGKSDNMNNTNSEPHSKSLLIQLAKHIFHKISMKKCQQWSPTPIQLQSWPILASKEPLNLIGISPTGSGKSLSFAIPLVLKGMESLIANCNNNIMSATCNHNKNLGTNNIIGLIVTPTRELAIQVSKVVALACKSANKLMKDQIAKIHECNPIMKSVVIYGGVDKSEQIDSLIGNRLEKTIEEGVNMEKSQESTNNSRCNCNIIVTATPGRLLDIMCLKDEANDENTKQESGVVSKIRDLFKATQMLVIDEADRMATQSDISKQVDVILSFLNENMGKNLTVGLFSATLPRRVSEKVNEWVSKPRCFVKVNSIVVGSDRQSLERQKGDDDDIKLGQKEMECDENDVSSSSVKSNKNTHRGPLNLSLPPSHVEQILHVCANHKKPKKLMTTLNKIRDNEQKDKTKARKKGLVIVFFSRIKTLQYVYQLLNKENIQSVQLHSQMKQDKREYQLNLFRSGKNPLLLATDIAARGIHINNVEYIINYDFPVSLEQVSYLVKS
jgi:superfamily II DNA/RNA helicase